jgi:hypothetical protein
LLGVIVEQLHQETARSTVALPADDALRQCAAKEGLVVAGDLSGPNKSIDGNSIQSRPLLPKMQ